MQIIGYVAAIFMGISLGLMGGGGSILTVPILVYLFAINPLVATVYSLFVVGSTAFVGGLTYFRKGEIDLKFGLALAVPSFIGVYLTRTFFVPLLPDPVFSADNFVISKPILIMSLFAILMVSASISMIRVKTKINNKMDIPYFKKWFFVIIEGFFVGMVTGFVGAGGGFLIIPALVFIIGLPMKKAVGTSLIIIAINSLIGFLIGIKSQSNVDWSLLFNLTAISISGLFLGIYLSKKISEKNLKISFGYFVLIMGTFILIDQILKFY